MAIKNIDEQKQIFDNYTKEYLVGATEDELYSLNDKRSHSVFVLEESLLVDSMFTKYNETFKNLLALESLFHDVGRFEQMKMMGTFNDNVLHDKHPRYEDHGDLGAIVIKEHGLLNELIPDVRIYDEEVMKTIKLHSKVNPDIMNGIVMDYITSIKNYDLEELFLSSKSDKEKDTLTRVNTAIIQDVDRLDIFRKIVKGIWVPMATDEIIDPEIYELFKQGKLPTMNEIKAMGKWNPNVGHLIRMSFINQMNLVPVLLKIKEEKLLDKIYEASGNELVLPAYEFAKQRVDDMINNSENGIIAGKRR